MILGYVVYLDVFYLPYLAMISDDLQITETIFPNFVRPGIIFQTSLSSAANDDDDVYFPLTQYYLHDKNHSNYLQLLSIIKEFKEL